MQSKLCFILYVFLVVKLVNSSVIFMLLQTWRLELRYIYNTVCIYSVTSCNVITTDTLIEKYLLRWHQGKNGYFLKNWEIKKCQFSTLKSICFNMHLKKSLKKFQFGFKLHFFWTVIWFLHLSNDLSNALSQITLKRKRPSASNFRSESPAGFVYNKQVGFKL